MRAKVVVLCVALALGSVPANAALTVIDKSSGLGDQAVAVAGGKARNPSALFVKVRSRPRQSITGVWSLVCTKGKDGIGKYGRYSGRTPVRKSVPLPYPDPDECTLSSSAQLARRGRIVVILLKG